MFARLLGSTTGQVLRLLGSQVLRLLGSTPGQHGQHWQDWTGDDPMLRPVLQLLGSTGVAMITSVAGLQALGGTPSASEGE